jgi:hypothetical protein
MVLKTDSNLSLQRRSTSTHVRLGQTTILAGMYATKCTLGKNTLMYLPVDGLESALMHWERRLALL